MIGRYGHEDSDRDRERARDEEAAEEREFELGRRTRAPGTSSWSPDPVEELADGPEEPSGAGHSRSRAELAPPPKEPAPEPPVLTPDAARLPSERAHEH